jgi:sulfide:quinone oxidoreductase
LTLVITGRSVALMAELGSPAGVLVVGGGVAALESLMALSDLAGDRVRVTLVAPEPDFVYRPMAVAEPFGFGEARRYPLRRIVEDFGAKLLQAGVEELDAAGQRIVLRSGDTLTYDTLVLAPGARMLPAFEDALTFLGPGSAPAMRALLDELDDGRVWRIAFVAPTVVGWTLPLYELALLTARHAADRGLRPEIVLVTPEQRPLALFGERPSSVVAELLTSAGIEFVGASLVEVVDGAVRLSPGGRALDAERVVALPLIRGPELEGVPAEPDFGFIPVDRHGRVEGLDGVYAAGDATSYPVKQGGLAAQQADAVAEHVAARHGAPVEPSPFRPVLRGMMFTGGPERYMREEAAAARPLWWPPTKIAGRYLAPYLYEREAAAAPGPAPEGFADLKVPLDTAEPVRG